LSQTKSAEVFQMHIQPTLTFD